MNARRSALRLVAMIAVLAVALVGAGGAASAKAHGHHHGGGSGSGPPGALSVTVSPNPSGEIGQSAVAAVIQVETLPSFAGDPVTINASQLAASCRGGFSLDTVQGGTPNKFVTASNEINVILDDDGNVTVVVSGNDCVSRRGKIEAALDVEPFYTATTWLKVKSPVVTRSGIFGEPQANGTAAETETGDTMNSGISDVYALFYVDAGASNAGQPVQTDFSQLAGSCSEGWAVVPVTGEISSTNVNTDPEITSNLDSNGNAVYLFVGARCAAAISQVNADVEAGTDPTYSTNFTVYPPAPAI